ncbi:MAG: hypothetical protein WBL68_13580, partial [Nitrososphaeraceae archaeon]
MCLRRLFLLFSNRSYEIDIFSFLVSNRFCNGGRYAVSQPYIGVNRALILSEAQKIFELMVRDLTITI